MKNAYNKHVRVLWTYDSMLVMYRNMEQSWKQKESRIKNGLFGKIFKKTAEKMEIEYSKHAEYWRECIEYRISELEDCGITVIRCDGMRIL